VPGSQLGAERRGYSRVVLTAPTRPTSNAHGVPQSRRRGIVLGVLAGVLGLGCCVYPVVLVLLGLSSATAAVDLGNGLYSDWGWAFKGAAVVFAGAAVLIQRKRARACSVERRPNIARVALWLGVSASQHTSRCTSPRRSSRRSREWPLLEMLDRRSSSVLGAPRVDPQCHRRPADDDEHGVRLDRLPELDPSSLCGSSAPAARSQVPIVTVNSCLSTVESTLARLIVPWHTRDAACRRNEIPSQPANEVRSTR
jgi:hypothetical protein